MTAYESWVAEVEFTPGVWTSVTSRVDTGRGGAEGSPFTVGGGDTPEASADSGGFSLPLLNHDHAFTPGNTLGPHHPIEPGIRGRVRDVVNGQDIALGTGYLRDPEIESWAGGNASEPRDQTAVFSFIDLVAFLDDSRTLNAALTEHILYRGGSDLKALWPLTNERAPFLGIGPVTSPMTVTRDTSGSTPPNAFAEPQAGETPTGAESLGLRTNRIYDSSTGNEAYNRVLAPVAGIFSPAIGASDAVTVVFWLNHREVTPALFQQIASFTILGSGSIQVQILRDATTGVWTLDASGAQTATITAGAVGIDALLPIGIRYSPGTPSMELWVGSARLTTTPTGSAPTGMTLAGPDFGFQIGAYDLSYAQVYIGSSWGYADYIEQMQQATAPLDRQTTGERIKTALAYSGVPVTTERIDPGVAVMGPTTMAGQKSTDLIRAAVETEQGEFYADGWGVPVFADRQRLYNV